jgi:hypothetical protein
MIPFFIELLRQAQDAAGTEGDAELTALAAVFDNNDLSQVCPVEIQI